jgi:hypothetical protein
MDSTDNESLLATLDRLKASAEKWHDALTILAQPKLKADKCCQFCCHWRVPGEWPPKATELGICRAALPFWAIEQSNQPTLPGDGCECPAFDARL